MPHSGIVKYNVKLSFEVDGLVERADVVGAIYGQTEGLLSPEMNLNELQKTSKVGRIEVRSKNTASTTTGTANIPMSTDIDTCSLVAAAVEGIDKVGPFDCKFSLQTIDDVRAAKKEELVRRAKEIKRRWKTRAISEGDTMLKDVHEGDSGRVHSYGPAGLPCGPDAERSKWVILVEGRADVINLLRSGFRNAVGIQGAKIDESIRKLCGRKERVVAFLDGDRSGGFILKELRQMVKVDVALQADPGIEVEELTPERVAELLDPVARRMEEETGRARVSDEDKELAGIVAPVHKDLRHSLEAVALGADRTRIFRTPITELVGRMSGQQGVKYLVLDGIITPKLFDVVRKAGVECVVGHRISKVQGGGAVALRTFSDLGIA